MPNRTLKTGKIFRVKRKRENPDEELKRMLELYTLVPPRSGKSKKLRESR
jgi:hypothetical protein